MDSLEVDKTLDYAELFGLSAEEQILLSGGEQSAQQKVAEVLDMLANNLRQEKLADLIHEPSEIFNGFSIAQSLAKDPQYVLEVIKPSFDQSSTS